jgi:hypothetical protein
MLLPSDKAAIKTRVEAIKRSFSLDRVGFIDGMTIIQKIKAIFPDFKYRREADVKMGDRSAYFEPGNNRNTIVLSETVFRGMNSGEAKYLKILLEEIGHFYLGHKYVRNHKEVRSALEKGAHTKIALDEAEADYFAECWMG